MKAENILDLISREGRKGGDAKMMEMAVDCLKMLKIKEDMDKSLFCGTGKSDFNYDSREIWTMDDMVKVRDSIKSAFLDSTRRYANAFVAV